MNESNLLYFITEYVKTEVLLVFIYDHFPNIYKSIKRSEDAFSLAKYLVNAFKTQDEFDSFHLWLEHCYPNEYQNFFVSIQEPTDLSPYRGLAAFEEKHARYFFGREQLTAQLVTYLTTIDF